MALLLVILSASCATVDDEDAADFAPDALSRNETAVLILADLTSEESKGSLARGLELMASTCKFAAERRVVIMHTGIDNTANPSKRRRARARHTPHRRMRRLSDEGVLTNATNEVTGASTLVPANQTIMVAEEKDSPEQFISWLWKAALLDSARYAPRLEVLDVTEAFNYKSLGERRSLTPRRRATEGEAVSGEGRRGGYRRYRSDAGIGAGADDRDRDRARDSASAAGPRALAAKPRRKRKSFGIFYRRMW